MYQGGGWRAKKFNFSNLWMENTFYFTANSTDIGIARSAAFLKITRCIHVSANGGWTRHREWKKSGCQDGQLHTITVLGLKKFI